MASEVANARRKLVQVRSLERMKMRARGLIGSNDCYEKERERLRYWTYVRQNQADSNYQTGLLKEILTHLRIFCQFDIEPKQSLWSRLTGRH